jgi:hypothetical protein
MSSRWKGRGENLARKGQAKLPRYFNALLAENREKKLLIYFNCSGNGRPKPPVPI